MAMPGTTTTAPTGVSRSTTDYRAMTIATVLFFMWGFLTCLNDILIPRLKGIFELNYAQVMMVQFAFFSSYFVFAQPAGWLVEWRGYKQTMVIGLLVMAAGAMLFLPAASLASFGVFLTALVILAAGMTCLQVAANPYVTSLGPENTAASRLNFSQGFNSLGTTIAPLVGGALILGGTQISPSKLHSLPAALIQAYRAQQASSVRLPYLGIGLTLVALAVALALLKMPPMVTSRPTQDFRPGAFNQGDGSVDTIWRHPWLLMGAAGIFLYVGAEVSIGSFLVNYFGLPQIMSMSQQTAAKFVGFYWGGAMIGRFIGSAVLQRVSTGLVLGCAAVVAGLLVVTSMLTHGPTAMWAIIAVGLFNSVMFPNIFTLGLWNLGPLTSKGSGLLVMSILGGALLPLLEGHIADKIGVQHAFFIPVLCYVFIACFGFAARNLMTSAAADLPIFVDPGA
jgi:FHS family L-fucose permease-like MFS transporter